MITIIKYNNNVIIFLPHYNKANYNKMDVFLVHHHYYPLYGGSYSMYFEDAAKVGHPEGGFCNDIPL